jgi:hypothetical protein
MVVTLLAVPSMNCGTNEACLAYAVAGLSVSVVNAADGQGICDATVLAIEGSYAEELHPNACAFRGLWERAGTYTVRVTRQGFRPNEVDAVRVVMGGGPCPHVTETRLTVALAAGE